MRGSEFPRNQAKPSAADLAHGRVHDDRHQDRAERSRDYLTEPARRIHWLLLYHDNHRYGALTKNK
jgi:hypothetical protein